MKIFRLFEFREIPNYVDKLRNKYGDDYDYSNIEITYVKDKNNINRTYISNISNKNTGLLYKTVRYDNLPDSLQPIDKGTKQYYIDKLINKYGNEYDYSNIEAVSGKHGGIYIYNISDKQGKLLYKPVRYNFLPDSLQPTFKGSKQYYIDKLINKFGDKYDYSNIEIVRKKDKNNSHRTFIYNIYCPVHKFFSIRSDSINKNEIACRKCASNTKTTEEFIEEAKNIHGDKYYYSLVNYKGVDHKIKIGRAHV